MLIPEPTRLLLFTGKGGVGKTSMACTTSVQSADAGRRTLLVSTDPASNLDEVLGTQLGQTPTPVEDVPNLWAMNVDPEAAAAAYRERIVGPYRGVLPDEAVRGMEEQFSGSCTLEIAAFDEFASLIGDAAATADYDQIIFDTAPTGHTLRLLTLPTAWSSFIDSNTSGTSCLGPLAGLEGQQAVYRRTVEALADPTCTTVVLVARPESASMKEAARTVGELLELGIANQRLLLNGIFDAADPTDPIAIAMQHRGRKAIAAMPECLARLPRTEVQLASQSLVGLESLRVVGRRDSRPPEEMTDTSDAHAAMPATQSLKDLVDEIAPAGRGLILTMGKGGVGKTTIAAAVAVGLAEAGHDVHLTTTDPAAHLTQSLGGDSIAHLTVGRIDPRAETERYANQVLADAGGNLDSASRQLLEEDLRSPCTEEIAVFRAFAEAVREAEDRFVVLDTAPTGHTILLLDAALAHHREVERQTSEIPDSVRNLLPRLRDETFTHVLLVALPEATPIHEASRLQDDLRRAGIEPCGWVVNQSLSPLNISDRTLRRRQVDETTRIKEVAKQHPRPPALVPWLPDEPVGQSGLRFVLSQRSMDDIDSPIRLDATAASVATR